MTLWFCALMTAAMVYNGSVAYMAMGSSNVQQKFLEIGLIAPTSNHIIPAHKPPPPENMMASIE